MNEGVNIREHGAAGDGIGDDGAVIQALLDGGERHLYIPAGVYRVVRTLRVPSHTVIEAEPCARVILSGELPKMAGDFLLANDDPVGGNEDITIRGGIWDGNFGEGYNDKHSDLFDMTKSSGACLNFVKVRGLELRDLVVANSVTYFVRLGEVSDFVIRNISLVADRIAHNQDGLHFGGGCHHGLVENLRALSRGQTNDDLLAFNADDSLVRLENGGLICAPIEHITVRHAYAADCHTAIRMLSATSAIRHIRVEDITAGVRVYALNMDGARYCRTPIFRDADFPNGAGEVSDVVIEGFRFYATRGGNGSLMHMETNVGEEPMTVNFRRLRALEPEGTTRPTVSVGKVAGCRLTMTENGTDAPAVSADFPDVSVRLVAGESEGAFDGGTLTVEPIK